MTLTIWHWIIWTNLNVCINLTLQLFCSYVHLDNQSSWEKFDDQKTNLTMAIDFGEKEKNDVQKVEIHRVLVLFHNHSNISDL